MGDKQTEAHKKELAKLAAVTYPQIKNAIEQIIAPLEGSKFIEWTINKKSEYNDFVLFDITFPLKYTCLRVDYYWCNIHFSIWNGSYSSDRDKYYISYNKAKEIRITLNECIEKIIHAMNLEKKLHLAIQGKIKEIEDGN